jgi:hypothetical protein
VKTLTLASLLALSLPPAMMVLSASPAFAASVLQTLDPDKDGIKPSNFAWICLVWFGFAWNYLDRRDGALREKPTGFCASARAFI